MLNAEREEHVANLCDSSSRNNNAAGTELRKLFNCQDLSEGLEDSYEVDNPIHSVRQVLKKYRLTRDRSHNGERRGSIAGWCSHPSRSIGVTRPTGINRRGVTAINGQIRRAKPSFRYNGFVIVENQGGLDYLPKSTVGRVLCATVNKSDVHQSNLRILGADGTERKVNNWSDFATLNRDQPCASVPLEDSYSLIAFSTSDFHRGSVAECRGLSSLGFRLPSEKDLVDYGNESRHYQLQYARSVEQSRDCEPKSPQKGPTDNGTVKPVDPISEFLERQEDMLPGEILRKLGNVLPWKKADKDKSILMDEHGELTSAGLIENERATDDEYFGDGDTTESDAVEL